MSEHRIINIATNIDLNLGVGITNIMIYPIPHEMTIKNIFIVFTNILTQQSNYYVIFDLYNIGKTNEKKILIGRFTTYSKDIFSIPINSLTPIKFPIFNNIAGKLDQILLHISVIDNDGPPTFLQLGKFCFIMEVE